MISVESFLKVADNSGAKVVKCIKIYGQGWAKKAFIGDLIVISVQKNVPFELQINKINKKRKILKGGVYKAILIRSKSGVRRLSGEHIKFGDNSVVLIKDAETLLCTRVFGPVVRELRGSKLMKILSLATGTF